MTEFEAVKNAQRLGLVWQTVVNDLPVLEERLTQILGTLNLPEDFYPPELPTAK